jgi:dipeptidyl aminopeptidase/acylaminoacyl peptidase
MVHGGFHERLDAAWFQLIDALVAENYVVIFPEYRGSRGYGPEIYDNDYGVTDTADVLASADFIARQPFVDPARLGIYGESRGGMVSLLALEHQPQRFKVAVDVVGLTDFVAYMAYKPEYRRREVAEESASFEKKLPDTNLPAYINVSPINFVDKIETPLLVLATKGDKVAPLTLHTGRLLDALKARGKVFDSKIYEAAPGGHIFMRGQSPERDDATARILAWYRRYFGGEAK